MFRAELWNATQWADFFYRSGAKYIVPTSKHHVMVLLGIIDLLRKDLPIGRHLNLGIGIR
jgi:hypothetical protein